mgnify:FL=1
MADTAAASVASAMTSAAVAASSAATAGLDSSGNHILTQILISGIVDLWLFTVDILVCCGSILRFVLMQVHRCIDQSDHKSYQDPGSKCHRHAFLALLHGPGHITDTILICSVGAFVYVVIHCIQCLVDLIITKIIIDISAGGQPASLLSLIGIIQKQNAVAMYLVCLLYTSDAADE